jgi:pyruvate dehydrogenase phosphatase
MLRRLWKPVVGTAVLVGAPGYLYFKYTSKPKPRETFDLSVRVRGPDGKATMSTRSITLLTKDEVEAKLHEHVEATATARRGIIWKKHTAYLSANDPIEDANASKIVQRDPSELSPPGDLLFYAVMDGHGGYHTSRLLSQVLIPAVAIELDLLTKEPSSIIPKLSTLDNLKALFSGSKLASSIPFDGNPQYVSLAIQRAFTNLDSEIVDSPLRLLAQAMMQEGEKEQHIPDLSKHPLAEVMLKPAMSGAY